MSQGEVEVAEVMDTEKRSTETEGTETLRLQVSWTESKGSKKEGRETKGTVIQKERTVSWGGRGR